VTTKAQAYYATDDLVRFPLHSRFDSINCVTLARTVCIPAMTEALLPMTSPAAYNNKSVLLETLPQMPQAMVAVAKALAFCKNNRTVCRILNFNPHILTLKKDLKLAKMENMGTTASIQEYHEMTELPTDCFNSCSVAAQLSRPLLNNDK